MALRHRIEWFGGSFGLSGEAGALQDGGSGGEAFRLRGQAQGAQRGQSGEQRHGVGNGRERSTGEYRRWEGAAL